MKTGDPLSRRKLSHGVAPKSPVPGQMTGIQRPFPVQFLDTDTSGTILVRTVGGVGSDAQDLGDNRRTFPQRHPEIPLAVGDAQALAFMTYLYGEASLPSRPDP